MLKIFVSLLYTRSSLKSTDLRLKLRFNLGFVDLELESVYNI